MEGIDVTYIHKCLHDPEDAPLCPIFKLGDIVKQSGFNFETIARVVSQLHYIFTQHWMDRKVFSGGQADFHSVKAQLHMDSLLAFCSFCIALLLPCIMRVLCACVLTGRGHWYCGRLDV